MPKLYEYLGINILFYSNEHEPVHVHGKYQDRESKAEFTIVNGQIIGVGYSNVTGKKPLEPRQFNDFKICVEHYAEEIVQKWNNYFIQQQPITTEKIIRRIR